jgi:hypothetical protein
MERDLAGISGREDYAFGGWKMDTAVEEGALVETVPPILFTSACEGSGAIVGAGSEAGAEQPCAIPGRANGQGAPPLPSWDGWW